ncbi:MAG: hypothetical protein OJI67_09690, partial [Prosthecobacter sp.]|nr:hypothetical protein [Prosthecobacter sp.]
MPKLAPLDISTFNVVNQSGCIPFQLGSSTSYLFDIGFNFSFYGRTFTRFYLNMNGFIQFYDPAVPPVTASQPSVFPDPSLNADIAALFWTPLDPTLWADSCISTRLLLDPATNASIREINYTKIALRGVLHDSQLVKSESSFTGTIQID